jgi:inosose dehydratase
MPAATRRTFLATALAATAAPPIRAAARNLRFGYAAITWGKELRQAIDDISAAGYAGIQPRGEALTQFQPAELRESLAQHKLVFVALSSGEASIDPAAEGDAIATHVSHAKYVRSAGGVYLQLLDQLKPYPRSVEPGECKRLGKLLTEIGKRTADIGVPLVYHNHMNSISERPANLDLVLRSSDPKYVHLLFDTAHSLAGGGDPVKAIEEYRDRIALIHLKDVIDMPAYAKEGKYPFQFVELGRGRVDLPGVFAALGKIGYQGWAMVELDRVPEQSKTPKECAMISREYLEKKIGVKFPAA